MILCFTLGMPGNNSWDGKWSGEGNLYAILKVARSKKDIEKAKEILKEKYYTHSFGDGWVASVTVKEVSAKEAAIIRKKSQGFCGYGWMVRSIYTHGKIQC